MSVKIPLYLPRLFMAQQILIHQIFVFLPPWALPSSLLKSQTTTPNILFFL